MSCLEKPNKRKSQRFPVKALRLDHVSICLLVRSGVSALAELLFQLLSKHVRVKIPPPTIPVARLGHQFQAGPPALGLETSNISTPDVVET